MKNYRYELHFHTSEVSGCAKVPAAEAVLRYHRLGYAGVVVTDHYYQGLFAKMPYPTWPEKVSAYLSGFERARSIGEQNGMTVLLGMEIRFPENNNDYLVYGISRDFLLGQPELQDLTLKTFQAVAREHGLLVYQAHPFRNTMTVMHPHLLDGLETVNGNPRHDARNNIAALWASQHGLSGIAGSDFHQIGDEGLAGIDTTEPIRNNQDLLRILKSKSYTLYTG
ncbi:MAG: PHP-associated domain-containing protein [Eubacteriales bacterium]|nr:PHP-associated domain-containing protein [Eubacteriales bacterium]